jgi:hypothetical protein
MYFARDKRHEFVSGGSAGQFLSIISGFFLLLFFGDECRKY